MHLGVKADALSDAIQLLEKHGDRAYFEAHQQTINDPPRTYADRYRQHLTTSILELTLYNRLHNSR